jgi:hypothetical protein
MMKRRFSNSVVDPLIRPGEYRFVLTDLYDPWLKTYHTVVLDALVIIGIYLSNVALGSTVIRI